MLWKIWRRTNQNYKIVGKTQSWGGEKGKRESEGEEEKKILFKIKLNHVQYIDNLKIKIEIKGWWEDWLEGERLGNLRSRRRKGLWRI